MSFGDLVILYVDNEHASVYDRPKMSWLGAARLRITYQLQDLTGDVCLVQRYPDVSPELIERLGIRAVFISGHGAPPELYDEADRGGLRAIVADGRTPVFGFCGGGCWDTGRAGRAISTGNRAIYDGSLQDYRVKGVRV